MIHVYLFIVIMSIAQTYWCLKDRGLDVSMLVYFNIIHFYYYYGRLVFDISF